MRCHAIVTSSLPLFCLTLAAVPAWAAPETPQQLVSVRSTAELESGSLLFKGESTYQLAPVVRTQVGIQVTGLVARTQVTQEFSNPSTSYVEGLYVFPLPEGAAVDRLRLQIGERLIEGQIKEKAAAVKAYEQAKAEGKKASLLEQERPNVFSTAVANVGPREKIVVLIEYQETLRYDEGRFSLRFPLTINPGHYHPPVEVSGFSQNGFAQYTPSAPLPASSIPSLDAQIRVDLDAGFEPAELTSASHPLKIEVSGAHRLVTLADSRVRADRDFVLSWRPATSQTPKAALFNERHESEGYALLMITPPQGQDDARAALPRETVLIIDTSGSMEGESMTQAKKALGMAIDQLREQDSFEIIQFSDGAGALFGESVPASKDNVVRAHQFVDQLRASGGTNMLSALAIALDPKKNESSLRQIVFVTDGAVGNEMELYRFIEERLGKSRLFTVGIGAAPNSWFMREAAQFGRGTFTFIGRVDEVEKQMGALFHKIASPVISDIQLDFGDIGAESWPDRMPDLYAGEPIFATVRLPRASKKVVVTGKTGGAPFRVELPLSGGADERGIHKLWARAKIEALTDRIVLGTPEEEVKPTITSVALAHGLVSKYTSLVAVDTTPTRPNNEPLANADAPAQQPAYAQAMPTTATPAELCLWLALGLGLFGAALLRKERTS